MGQILVAPFRERVGDPRSQYSSAAWRRRIEATWELRAHRRSPLVWQLTILTSSDLDTDIKFQSVAANFSDHTDPRSRAQRLPKVIDRRIEVPHGPVTVALGPEQVA